MATEEEDMIAKHNMYLLYHLRPSVKRIIKYLHEEQVIVPEDTEKILSQAADTMKTQHLLDKLHEIGRHSLDYLYAATLFTKIWPAADVLDPKKRPHKEEEQLEPLPETWPSEDHSQSLSEETLTVKEVEKKNSRMKEYFDNPKKYNVYEMDQERKGRALIINNYEFDHLRNRSGTHEDRKGLEVILNALNFDVKVAEDLTAKEMEDMLKAECKEDHSKYNCFILVILSHGDLGIVFGKDGIHKNNSRANYLEIDQIVSGFSKVESLVKKPKLFIIQACRGRGDAGVITRQTGNSGHRSLEEEEENEEDEMEKDDEEMDLCDLGRMEDESLSPLMDQHQHGTSGLNPSNASRPGMSPLKDTVLVTSQDGSKGETSEDEDDGGSSDDEEGELNADKLSQPLDNTEDLSEGKPLHFLIALPTTEGNKSWRNKHKGSWFIQAFIYVLANYAYREDLDTLMLKVNELVRRAGGSGTSEVPELESTLIKRLFFFPGMEKA